MQREREKERKKKSGGMEGRNKAGETTEAEVEKVCAGVGMDSQMEITEWVG